MTTPNTPQSLLSTAAIADTAAWAVFRAETDAIIARAHQDGFGEEFVMGLKLGIRLGEQYAAEQWRTTVNGKGE